MRGEPALHPIPSGMLERPIAIVGATGSGKTYAAKGAVEQLLAQGRRVCIVDPTGAWWGLRSRADGTPGFPVVIFGGEHADVPIGMDAGDRLGRLIAAGGVRAAIVDTSEFSTGESIRLLTPFFEALYSGLRGPLHLVVDEADAMAPQNPMPEGRRLLGVVDKIARRGRKKGFRPLWITQRPAVLNKNVLSQVATLVAMKLRGPQDRKALDAWIQGNADPAAAKDVVQRLSALQTGTGFVWCPDEDVLEHVAFPAITTADTSRAPEDGEDAPALATLAEVDVAALREALASPPEHLKETADHGAAEARAFERGRAVGLVEGREAAAGELARLAASIASQLRDLADDLDRHSTAPIDAAEVEPLAAAAPTPCDKSAIRPKRRVAAEPTSRVSEPGVFARKLLDALDTQPPAWRTWREVAILAGVRARGGHFNAQRKALLDSGLLDIDGDRIRIGVPSAAAPPPTVDRDALVAVWAGKLGGAAGRILTFLAHDAGGVRSRPAIATELGLQPRGGHWNAAWKALRDDGLVVVVGDVARLTDLLAGGNRS